MILLFLAVAWAVFLIPTVLRKCRDRRSGDAVRSFHTQLQVLHKSSPGIIYPAHRLDGEQAISNIRPIGVVDGVSSIAAREQKLTEVFLAASGGGGGASISSRERVSTSYMVSGKNYTTESVSTGSFTNRRSMNHFSSSYYGGYRSTHHIRRSTRRRTRHKRQQVLLVGSTIFIATLILSLIPVFSILWMFAVLSGFLLGCYIAALIMVGPVAGGTKVGGKRQATAVSVISEFRDTKNNGSRKNNSSARSTAYPTRPVLVLSKEADEDDQEEKPAQPPGELIEGQHSELLVGRSLYHPYNPQGNPVYAKQDQRSFDSPA